MSNRPYAKETTVPWRRSKQEIEDLIEKRDGTATGTIINAEQCLAIIAFELDGYRFRFSLPLPHLEDFVHNQKGRRQAAKQVNESYEKELRRKWRSLLATVKAKFISVEDGIEVIESAFMAQIVMPNGMTMEEWAVPQLHDFYASGNMPPLLPGG
jgi:hypothetical protein